MKKTLLLIVAILFIFPQNIHAKVTCRTTRGINIYDHHNTAHPTSFLTTTKTGYMRIQAEVRKENATIDDPYTPYIDVIYYDQDFNIISKKTITSELPLFGTFYETDENYYLITGQKNSELSNDITCIQATKFDKNWNKIKSCGIGGALIVKPFSCGCNAAVNGSRMLINTGLDTSFNGHEWSHVFEIDINKMEFLPYGTWNYTVSHSFAHFAGFDGNYQVFANRGDASPNGLVLQKSLPQHLYSEYQCIIVFPHAKDKIKKNGNGTGSNLSGFEISDTSYLLAACSTDQDDTTDNYVQNAFIASVDKETNEIKINWLTHYDETIGYSMPPSLTKINNNKYLVMWKREFPRMEEGTYVPGYKTFYTFVDGEGNTIDKIYEKEGNFKSDCNPIIHNGYAIWYTWDFENETFYKLPLDKPEGLEIYEVTDEHDYEEKIIQEKKSCTDEEITEYTCKKCGDTYKKVTKPAGKHEWGEAVKTKTPTFETEGEKEYTCQVCGEKKTESVPALVDDWYGDDYGETVEGKTMYEFVKSEDGFDCVFYRYNKSDTDVADSITVKAEEKITTKPTCTNVGWKTITGKGSFEGHGEISGSAQMVVNRDKDAHGWDMTPVFEWSEDYTSCDAILTCLYNKKHTKRIPMEISLTKKERTDGVDGYEVTYTASGEGDNGQKYSDKKTIKTEEKIWRLSDTIEYTKALDEDGYHFTATRRCPENSDYDVTIELTTTFKSLRKDCEKSNVVYFTGTGTFADGMQARTGVTLRPSAGEHIWDFKSKRVEPTCTEDGSETRTCLVCGKEEMTVLPKTGHSFTIISETPSTCTKEGERISICQVCGERVTEVIEKIPHQWDTEPTIDKEPDCEKEGEQSIHCSCCDERKDIQPVPATGHQYEKTIISHPKCEEAGLMEKVCQKCGKKEEEKIPPTGHEAGKREGAYAASCQAEGYTGNAYCIHCGKLLEEGKMIPKTDHKYSLIKKEAASCEKDGKRIYRCDVCGDEKTESIPATGHKWVSVTDKEAGCEEPGERSIQCSICGERKNIEAIPATGHKYEKKVVRKATCEQDGMESYTCRHCGDTYTKIVPATGHTIETDPAVPATAEKDGLTQGSHCSKCGKVFVKQQVIPRIKENSSDPATVAAEEKKIAKIQNDGDIQGSSFRLLKLKGKKVSKATIKLEWSRVNGASGYLIYGNMCNAGGKKYPFKLLKTVTGTSWTQTKLKKGTYYKYLVIAYKNIGGSRKTLAVSKTIHTATSGGKVGNHKSVKVNRKSVKLKKGKSFKIKAKQIPKKLKVKKHRNICYESSNPLIATVTKSGKVKGKKKGACLVYVYAQNGVAVTIKVKVK